MSNSINIEIGKRIFDARKKLKISRAELGKKVNLHESTVKRYEDGQIKSLDIEKMKEFANALDVDVKELIGWGESHLTSSLIHEQLPLSFKRRYYVKCDENGHIISYTSSKYYQKYKHDLDFYFDKLNDKGKKEALKRIEELTYIPKYNISKDNIETIAAHNDCLNVDGEIDKIKDDIEDMKNW